MTHVPRILLLGGFGGSGSSIVADLLKETDEAYLPRQEIRIIVDPDGLMSLESALVDNWSVYQSDVAIRRFLVLAHKLSHMEAAGPYVSVNIKKDYGRSFFRLAKSYVDRLLVLKFHGLWFGIDDQPRRRRASVHQAAVRTRLERGETLHDIIYDPAPWPDRAPDVCREMYFTRPLSRREFLTITRDFLAELVRTCPKRNGKENWFVIDEPFSSFHADRVLSYLPSSARIIVVSRDPRDQFVSMHASRWLYQPGDLESFIRFQETLYRHWHAVRKRFPASRLLHLRFEDFAWDHEATVRSVFRFLSIDPGRHRRPGTVLSRKDLAKKVGQWRRALKASDRKRLNDGLRKILRLYRYPN